jgi:hypothetical protein
MGKDWKEYKDEWLGNYTLGGFSTLSMSPDLINLKQLSNQKGHLLEVLGDGKYSQDKPIQQTIVQQHPITLESLDLHPGDFLMNCFLNISKSYQTRNR